MSPSGDTRLRDHYDIGQDINRLSVPKPDKALDDQGQSFIVAEEAPWVPGDDGDDNPESAKRKQPPVEFNGETVTVKLKSGKTSDVQIVGAGDITESVQVRRTDDSQVVADLQSANHGFLIREQQRPKTLWRTTCEICDGALPLIYEEWVCELGSEPGTVEWWCCECGWCQLRGQWLRGEYRPRGGRPPKRCGTAECNRKAARIRQSKSRAARKAQVSQKPL